MPPTGQPTIDVSNLDDAELSQMLKDYGVDVGPINAATRRTYERRLMKLKAGVEPTPRYQPVDDDDDEDEEENKVPVRKTYEEKLKPKIGVTPSPRYWSANNGGDDEDDEVQVRRPEPSSRPVPILSEPPQPQLRKVRETQRSTDFSPRIESRPSLPAHRMTPLSYTPPASRSNPVKVSQEKKKSSLLWLKLLALAVAIILLYLIYVNMEPAAQSNIPGIQNKIEV